MPNKAQKQCSLSALVPVFQRLWRSFGSYCVWQVKRGGTGQINSSALLWLYGWLMMFPLCIRGVWLGTLRRERFFFKSDETITF